MVSISLFFMVAILVFNLYPGSLLSLRRAERRVEANRLAESVLSQARARSFAELVVDTSAVYEQDVEDVHYRCRLQILAAPPAPVARLKRLRVTVDWKQTEADRQVVHEVLVSSVR